MKPQSKLGFASMGILMFIAAIADVATLVPFVGDVVAPIYWVAVSLFLYFKGFGMLNPRKLVTSGLSMVAEMIPVIQEFPMLMVGTVVVLTMCKLEEKTGIKAGSLSTRTINPRISRIQSSQNQTSSSFGDEQSVANTDSQPLYKDGVRQPSRNMDLRPLNNDGVRNPGATKRE